MKVSSTYWTWVGLICVTASALTSSMATAETIPIVSPSSNTNTEGSGSRRPNLVPLRVQHLIPAANFAELPDSNHQLVAFNFRADRSQTTSLDWGYGVEQIWMSTTERDQLTDVFADNHGVDKTLVYDGPIKYSLLGTGPVDGPRDIANGPLLQTPFHYDPSQGNLLIEQLTFVDNPSQQANIDIQLEVPGRLLINDVNPDSATGYLLTSVPVLQFEFAAVPDVTPLLGDFNGDDILDSIDIDDLTQQSASGTNNTKYDLTGDSLVDEKDVNKWISDPSIFKSWVGDANLDKEFTSGDLVVVLAAGTYENDVDAVWTTGDFNGEGRTNSGDLVAALAGGGYEAGPQAVAAVPEPSSLLLALCGLLMLPRRPR